MAGVATEVPPLAVVTVMSTLPTAPAGEVAVIWVGELTVNLVAALVPNFTVVVPVKFLPRMVTTVPPFLAPELGLIDDTAGGVT